MFFFMPGSCRLNCSCRNRGEPQAECLDYFIILANKPCCYSPSEYLSTMIALQYTCYICKHLISSSVCCQLKILYIEIFVTIQLISYTWMYVCKGREERSGSEPGLSGQQSRVDWSEQQHPIERFCLPTKTALGIPGDTMTLGPPTGMLAFRSFLVWIVYFIS